MSKEDFINHFIELWGKFKEDHPNTNHELVNIDWFVEWLLMEKQS